MIAIIDYDAGNLKSVQKALDFLHQECVITRDFHEIRQADKVILPGVGSFGGAMVQLKKYELDLWNNGRLFAGLPEHPYVYFVHSYYLKAKDDRIVKATT